MTTTYYASVNDFDTIVADVDHAGTSSTSGDVIELRMGNGTYAPNRFQVLKALMRIRRWIISGGLDGAGANLPPPV